MIAQIARVSKDYGHAGRREKPRGWRSREYISAEMYGNFRGNSHLEKQKTEAEANQIALVEKQKLVDYRR